MVNLYLELERLKASLRAKGLDEDDVRQIVEAAEQEISTALSEQLDQALELAVQSGVQKRSPDFINDLRPRPDAFIIDTSSGKTDFSEPPFPMLDRLLARGVKPMKDGKGVYRVIPMGSDSKPLPPVHTSIFDAQKAMYAKQYEDAARVFNRVKPKSSKVTFRTATSKQDRNTQWVQPAKEKNFTEDLQEINSMLSKSHEEIIMDIIRQYEEAF